MSTIKLQRLEFENMFSYGGTNVIELDKSKITQLTAPNGSGKSSIAMIIQEALFNKNVKGIKKGDILNRWSKSKSWKVMLGLTQVLGDTEVTYDVQVVRTGAQTKVQLWEDGVDITEHKVLDTYKKLNQIVGTDFEVFSQLTYQSSTDLLEFLKATDANRKKFLINLFYKGVKYEWTDKCQESFQVFKDKLIFFSVFVFPDIKRDFVIYCDVFR